MPAGRHKQVRWLDVSVNDTNRVNGIESVSDVSRKGQKDMSLERVGDAFSQEHSLEQLHHDEGTSLMFPDVVNCANIWVIQCRGGLRFAAESLQSLCVSCQFFGQEFEGHKAIQPGVLRFINDTHASAPQPLNDAIMRDYLVDHSA